MSTKFALASGSTVDRRVWTSTFTSFNHHIEFTASAMDELECGLKLGRLLNIPPKQSINDSNFMELLAIEKLRPFDQLK